ncbi:MAG: PHP domain-containing protein [Candidatus Hodarchaeaceae archaeon]|nr:PHP domain-containing protein [Candidatus Hodarchaeaceae archaeon]
MPAKFDFHLHTSYSDGTSAPPAMVEAAEARGLEAVAFTDHGPELSVGTPREKLDLILQDIELAREDAGIPVLASIEANVVDERGRIDVEEEFTKKLDLLMVAIHNLRGTNDRLEMARDYLMRATRAIEQREVNVFAHPFFLHHDLLPHLSREEIEDFVRLAAARGVAMEVNMKYKAPGDEFFALCLREGVKLSIGSDAHTLAEVGRIDWALATLRRVGAKREDLILDSFLR